MTRAVRWDCDFLLYILTETQTKTVRRRTKLAHALKDYGQRVQYSVFECRLKEEQLTRLQARVTALIDTEEDSVRIYRLCAECAGRLEIQGLGRSTQDPDVYML